LPAFYLAGMVFVMYTRNQYWALF